ncbi:gliding motility-associated C-terminal domain-containing protein [Sinomicrobium kalidii]|uniref:T9SS type B sorting domain-containing protein n=1 Tax=Sinomicrobium kalidii TaxID=2900738 RepID=UPI001E606C47|nr:gliding motility-associated C-terminal domain-containing protein [Sinomicrobium kalidii]UGU15043.1 gliding motility-associated C-terminal domain-containing protein [Sinomicrobium kalidii]
MHKFYFTFLIACLAGVFVQAQTIIHVAPKARGTGDGLSWENARSIQNAVNNASEDDEIWIQAGTYHISETLNLNVSDVKLFGGFDGTEETRGDRDWKTNKTILDGGGSTQILVVNEENTAFDEIENMVIDGIRFKNGRYTGAGAGGGALHINPSDESNITIRSCRFNNNFSETNGGALYIVEEGYSYGKLVVNKCQFSNNTAEESGGAVYVQNRSDVRFTFKNSVFTKNTAKQFYGGAIRKSSGGNGVPFTVQNCKFVQNETGGTGGALGLEFSDSDVVEGSRFTANKARDGGAIGIRETLTIRDNYFKNNQATVNGGAIHTYSHSTTLYAERCHFVQNTAGENGGAIYNAGNTIDNENMTMVNSLFQGNVALVRGGAIYNNNGGWLSVVNCTFVNNSNTAVIYDYYDSNTKIYNSVFWDNTTEREGYYPDISSDYFPVSTDVTLDVRRNILQKYPDGTANLIMDPLLTANFHLQPGSPAIDAGAAARFNEVSLTRAANTTDLGGNDRRQGENIDIGAFEAKETEGETEIIPNNNILYVDQNVDTADPNYTDAGDSWENAVVELRDALDWAQDWDATTDGALQIWVATGNYRPTGDPTDREATFQLVSGVEIYGGFDATETDLDERDWENNVAVLSGDIDDNDAQDIITDPQNQIRGANSYNVVTGSGTDNTAALNGFTITGGSDNSGSIDGGGGIFMESGSPSLGYLTIIGNRATVARNGGGVFITGSSAPTITHSRFTHNFSGFRGGGIINNGGTLIMAYCTISGNMSNSRGGGVSNAGTLEMMNCLIFNNETGSAGGGISNFGGGTLTLTNCTVTENTANSPDYGGGGINNQGTLTLNNSILWGNEAPLVGKEFRTIGTATFSHSLYADSAYDVAGTITDNGGNLNADPLFTDPANDDYSLQSGSPAIDTGDNSLYTAAGGDLQNDLDLAGNPRVFDYANGSIIDMGVFEAEFSDPPPLACAFIENLTDGADGISLDTNITWGAVEGATGYHLSIRTNEEIIYEENTSDTIFTPENGLEEGTTYYVSVIPYNENGSEAEGCDEISFTTETLTPPDCAVITTPVNGTTYPAYEGIGWESVEGADGYRIYMGTTPGGTDVANGLEHGEDFEDPEWGTYYLKVIPYNEAGEATGCEEISFSIVEPTPLPPGCTTITSPANGDTDVPLDSEITWDAVEDASGYYISVRTGAGDIVVNEEPVTGTSYNPATDFKENTTYHVSVVPFNDNGAATGCDEIRFTTETLPIPLPVCTTMISPANGDTGIALDTEITWEEVANADEYYISIGTTSGGTDIVNHESVTGTTYIPEVGLEENTTYFIIVTPYNDEGSAEDCTEISFTTETLPKPPDCTTMYRPVNGATNVPVSAAISWNAVPEADGYYLTVGTTSGGTDLVDNEDVGDTTVYDLVNDLPGSTEIYVSVVPYNTEGEAENCQEESFTTKALATPPDCTTIISPANGESDVAIATDISWNTIADADGYRISIGTTAGGSEIVDHQQVSGNSFTPVAELDENTTYYVRVVPYNAEGSAAGCDEISFTTETLPAAPGCTTITSPIDGESDVAIATDISWNTIADADGYYISIGTAPGGTDVVNNRSVTGTTFSPPVDLDGNMVYYVSVVPYNVQGSATGCTGIRFTTRAADVDINKTKYGFSPNGDGNNDFWKIEGIENYPDNTVSVYNRWGDMVFRVQEYDNHSNVFRGQANKLTGLGAGKLPSGTYFFDVQFREGDEVKTVKGFVVIKR